MRIAEAECLEIVVLGRLSNTNHERNLAHVLEHEHRFDEDDRRHREAIPQSHLREYVRQRARDHHEESNVLSMTLDEILINFMQPVDFNPSHSHFQDAFSFALYLQAPNGLREEHEQNDTNKSDPREIECCCGQSNHEGMSGHQISPDEIDRLIFPARLVHFAQPYKTREEWASAAGNVVTICEHRSLLRVGVSWN